jgi:hypothetical protein
MRGITAALALLAVTAVLLTVPVTAQTGWNLKQFVKKVRTTPNPMTISVLNAKTWGTGFSTTYTPVVSACEEYRVTLTVGAKFISLTVTNPQVCDYPTPCNPKRPGLLETGLQVGAVCRGGHLQR